MPAMVQTNIDPIVPLMMPCMALSLHEAMPGRRHVDGARTPRRKRPDESVVMNKALRNSAHHETKSMRGSR
ncbi:MAG: hypothetical protein ACXW29_11685, partial [Thermoanaerobaculia bacterium]